MNKKLVVIVASILFIAAAASASAQNVDTKIVGFESSVVYGYDVNAQSMGYANSYGINLTLTDSLVAGFLFTSNAGGSLANSFMLNLAYGIADKYGMKAVLVARVSYANGTASVTAQHVWAGGHDNYTVTGTGADERGALRDAVRQLGAAMNEHWKSTAAIDNSVSAWRTTLTLP